LHRFQFGGEALRPDGLLGVVLPSLVLLAKELANELLGALRNTRERGPLRAKGVRRRGGVVVVQRLGVRAKQEYGNRRLKGWSLPQTAADHRRSVRRTFIGALDARHCYRKA